MSTIKDTNGNTTAVIRWSPADWIKLAGVVLALAAFMWAFGDGLFGNLGKIDANAEMIVANAEASIAASRANAASISEVADSVMSIALSVRDMVSEVRNHVGQDERHQTRGEKFSDREEWYTYKENAIGQDIADAITSHEAGGRPHADAARRLDNLDAVVKELEIAVAELRIKINVLGNAR